MTTHHANNNVAGKSEQLSILTDVEKVALYALPDFHKGQQLEQQAPQIARRDAPPGFVATKLIIWLNEQHIIRLRYTTLQKLLSSTLSAERWRLGDMLTISLAESACMALSCLLKSDDTLSQLAALKQDAKDFAWRHMAGEREKYTIFEPTYQIARTQLPQQDIDIAWQHILLNSHYRFQRDRNKIDIELLIVGLEF